MRYIEITLRDGRKSLIRADYISKVTEYPYEGIKHAEIHLLGDVWGVFAQESYEDIKEILNGQERSVQDSL